MKSSPVKRLKPSPFSKIEGGVDEIEDIIVGNKDMPIEDWRKAHTFSAISLTIYNYRCLAVNCRAEFGRY